jgi:lambda repressor-like predicted transcriptional regulator
LSSFEAEINGYFEAFKLSARLTNVASELGCVIADEKLMFGDNEKGIEFLNGKAEGKGLRHALKRLSYLREELVKNAVKLSWCEGKTLIADALTKVVTVEIFENFRADALGWQLLGIQDTKWRIPEEVIAA